MSGAETVDRVDELDRVLSSTTRAAGFQDEAGEDLGADAGGAQVGQSDVQAGAGLHVAPLFDDLQDRVAMSVEEPHAVDALLSGFGALRSRGPALRIALSSPLNHTALCMALE
jgi:hypothetical protein